MSSFYPSKPCAMWAAEASYLYSPFISVDWSSDRQPLFLVKYKKETWSALSSNINTLHWNVNIWPWRDKS